LLSKFGARIESRKSRNKEFRFSESYLRAKRARFEIRETSVNSVYFLFFKETGENMGKKKKPVKAKPKTSNRVNSEKGFADLARKKEGLKALRKKKFIKDFNLNLRLKILQEFQMKILKELQENKAGFTDIMKSQFDYSKIQLAEKDRIIRIKNKELMQAVAEAGKREVEFRKTKAENEELKLRQENLVNKINNYKLDRSKIEDELKAKERFLAYEKTTAINDIEGKRRKSINELKDILYKKNLKLAEAERELSSLKIKGKKEKETGRKEDDAKAVKALKDIKYENDNLKAIIKEREAEFRKLKESLYLNEGAIKKEIGSRAAESERIKKELEARSEELENKFKKEKELLEQYLKTAKEETEKLKKEITIKNMLSNI